MLYQSARQRDVSRLDGTRKERMCFAVFGNSICNASAAHSHLQLECDRELQLRSHLRSSSNTCASRSSGSTCGSKRRFFNCCGRASISSSAGGFGGASSRPQWSVRGSGFRMATVSNLSGSGQQLVAGVRVGVVGRGGGVNCVFQEAVVGQKVNLNGGFFGRRVSLSVKGDAKEQRGEIQRTRTGQPDHELGVFCSIAPSPAQEKAPQAQPPTPTSDGKKTECFGVFCVTYDLKEDQRPKTWKKTIRIAVSGAAGMIANHLVFKLAAGDVFGQDQPIALNLLGSIRSRDALEGVAMELEDSLFPLLREVNIGIEAEDIFRDADWALLIGAKPRGPGMERADLLDINGQIFADQGRALNAVANPNVKVLVIGNPCNTNALIALKNSPRINPKNFHALTRLDENRAKCQLALKAGVFYDNVSNCTIWGNHSTTQVPDFLNAKIHGRHVKDVITDHKWLEEEFTPRVQKRGGALIQKWGRSSAASTAVSIVDAIKSLITPTPEGDWFSSGVYTRGNPYGIAEDIVFSMPCRSKGDGDYELVSNLLIDDYLYERIKKSEDELLSEKKCVAHLIGEDGGVCDITEDTMLPGEQ